MTSLLTGYSRPTDPWQQCWDTVCFLENDISIAIGKGDLLGERYELAKALEAATTAKTHLLRAKAAKDAWRANSGAGMDITETSNEIGTR
jgi:hypothetical protein